MSGQDRKAVGVIAGGVVLLLVLFVVPLGWGTAAGAWLGFTLLIFGLGRGASLGLAAMYATGLAGLVGCGLALVVPLLS